ncbi:TIR domain-containing protein, partial [Geobacter pelophilus]
MQRDKLVGSICASGNFEAIRFVWNSANIMQRDKLIGSICASGNFEAIRFVWNSANVMQRDKLVESICASRNLEAVKFVWNSANIMQKNILVACLADSAFCTVDTFFVKNENDTQDISESTSKDSPTNIITHQQTPILPILGTPENLEKRSEKMTTNTDYHVFVSHASEDKDDFVRPLAHALRGRGVSVWYDEFSLSWGDSLRNKIDEGLTKSQYGIVVLSHKFFEKNWPLKELDGLISREDTNTKVILPIWHGVDSSDIAKYSPILASKLAVSSSIGISGIVNKFVELIGVQNI